MDAITVLIAEDHTLVREGTHEILAREPDLSGIETARQAADAGRAVPDRAAAPHGTRVRASIPAR